MLDALETEVEKLRRHLEVLAIVIEKHPIGIGRIADETESPNHKVRYSLRKLQDTGLIEPTDRGAIPTDRVTEFLEDHGDRLDGVIESLGRTLQSESLIEISGSDR